MTNDSWWLKSYSLTRASSNCVGLFLICLISMRCLHHLSISFSFCLVCRHDRWKTVFVVNHYVLFLCIRRETVKKKGKEWITDYTLRITNYSALRFSTSDFLSQFWFLHSELRILSYFPFFFFSKPKLSNLSVRAKCTSYSLSSALILITLPIFSYKGTIGAVSW